MMMNRKDEQITCQDCGKVFTFTASEQEFYASHDFNYPKRCKACREARKDDKRRKQYGR